MSSIELKKRLIEKIRLTDDKMLLEEAYRLLEANTDETDHYILNDGQKNILEESRVEIKTGKYLTNDDANKEIEGWF